MTLDPALVKIGFFVLVVVAQAIGSANKKRKAKERELRPPQSSIGQGPQALPPQKPIADSPWSNLNGPFD